MKGRPIRVIADDLTGAADAGAALLGGGEDVTLTLGLGGGYWEDPGRRIVALDTATRDGDPERAATRARSVAESAPSGAELFKKVDSALRGHVAVEIRALHDRFPRRLVMFAPAFPGNSRITRGGVQHVGGIPLHLGDLWRAEARHPPASIVELLGGQPSTHLGLGRLRGDPGRLVAAVGAAATAGQVVICDAETDDDLDRVVAAGSSRGSEVIWAGSAGLASALCRARLGGPRSVPARSMRRAGPYLAVIGSAARAAQAQAWALARQGGAEMVALPAEVLAQHDPAVTAELAERVRVASAGGDTVVTVAGDVHPDWAEAIATSLVAVTAPAAAAAAALVLTGGTTARAVLAALGVAGLELMVELDPGIVLACPLGCRPVPVITKSGAFGDESTLLRALGRITAEEGSTWP